MADPRDPETDMRAQLLIRDAEEQVQKERMMALWQQWGSTIVGMGVMLVLGTGIGVTYREWTKSNNERDTAALIAMTASDTPAPNPAETAKLTGEHAAVAYLVEAGALKDVTDPAKRRDALAALYDKAAQVGGNSTWAWLARWNGLRQKMDDAGADNAALIKGFEGLAADMQHSALAALPLMDAAIIAGERLKDPVKALSYLSEADKKVTRASAMAATLGDLRRLYDIERQTQSKTNPTKPAEVTP